MAETLAVGGVILLVLAVTGGIEVIATKLVEKKEFIPMGDRVAAALLGGALIGLAVALQVGWDRWGLWITLGLLAAAVLWYATFLGRRL